MREFRLRLASGFWPLELRAPCTCVSPQGMSAPVPTVGDQGRWLGQAGSAAGLRVPPPVGWALGKCPHPSPCLFLARFLWLRSAFPSGYTWPHSLRSASPLSPPCRTPEKLWVCMSKGERASVLLHAQQGRDGSSPMGVLQVGKDHGQPLLLSPPGTL